MSRETPKIQKAIPIPPARHRSGICKAMREMAVGDSFLHPTAKTSSAASNWFTYLKPRKFTARMTGEGVRIWRIA